jgi:hypothetical protein
VITSLAPVLIFAPAAIDLPPASRLVGLDG